MSHVFISYRHDNGTFTKILEKKIRAAKLDVWIDAGDDKIPPGAHWREKIDKAIKDAFAQAIL